MRTQHIDALYGFAGEHMRARSTAVGMDVAQRADIPCMPAHTPDNIIEAPHLQAVGFLAPIEHPSERTLRPMGGPNTWWRNQRASGQPTWRRGEHALKVLGELGHHDETIAAFAPRKASREVPVPEACA